MRSLLGRLVLPLICVLLGCGIYLFGGLGAGTPVTCGGTALQPGASCTHLSHGTAYVTSYDKQKADENRVNVFVQTIGLAVIGVGVLTAVWVFIGWSIRSARRDDENEDDQPAHLQLAAGPHAV